VSTNRLSGHFSCGAANVPGQQLLDAVDGVIGDAGQHLAQISFRVKAVEFGGANQAVDRRRAFPARI